MIATHTHTIVNDLHPLLVCKIKEAQRHGLNEIRISVPRAKMALHSLTVAKKALTSRK
jgi:hypothetical protein